MTESHTSAEAGPEAVAPGAADFDVIVIGAGFSGLGAAIALRAAGRRDFVIVERASAVGGVWRDNTYPGVAVDVPAVMYSYSYEQTSKWSRVYAEGHELLDYAEHCVRKYDLARHLMLDSAVVEARYDEGCDLWSVRLAGGGCLTSRYLILATGGYANPRLPAIPGINRFRGEAVHTADWRHDLDLDGKRVGVIGTGSSAAQLVPTLADRAERLIVFQRTPPWVLPKLLDVEVRPGLRWVFDRVPLVHRAARLAAQAVFEVGMVLVIIYKRRLPFLAWLFTMLCRAHLRFHIRDSALRAAVTPRYAFGCKRPVLSNDYLSTLARDDVDLVAEPVTEVMADGVRTRSGAVHKLDVLVMATGFRVLELGNTPPFPVHGLDGIELGRFWHDHRYQAYEGSSVPCMPNLWMILGPYAFSGSSWFGMVEYQSRHALRCMEEADRRGATRVTVRQEAHDSYFDQVQRRQRNSLFFNSDCQDARSDLFDVHGDVPILRPAPTLEAAWRAGHFSLEDYEFSTRPDQDLAPSVVTR